MKKQFLVIDDVACRLGGDAFGIITPNTETDNASQLAERITRELEQLKFTHMTTP